MYFGIEASENLRQHPPRPFSCYNQEDEISTGVRAIIGPCKIISLVNYSYCTQAIPQTVSRRW